jgi:uncharacterized protein (DUF1499 family)
MVYARILLYLSLAASFLFLISGYGYQWEIWSLSVGFTLLRYSAYTAIGVTLISLASIWFLRKSKTRAITYTVVACLLSGIVSGTALFWNYRAQSAPPIHDISTDLESPPEFIALLRVRAGAPNQPDYPGGATADEQRRAYPHIQPLELDVEIQEVMDAAVMLLARRNWEFVAINRNEGRIEATEKLPWFGFSDDVILRFTRTPTGTVVDMRSKSRVGRGDLGVNARRIDRFLKDLEASLH